MNLKTKIIKVIDEVIIDFNNKWTSHEEKSFGTAEHADRIINEINYQKKQLDSALQDYLKGRELTIEEEVYLALEKLDLTQFDTALGRFLNTISPNLTVCPCCRVDDFTHVENCELYKINKNLF